MGITPAQLTQQVVSTENTAARQESTPPTVPATEPSPEITSESTSTPSSFVLPDPYSTDMKVDDQHQVYYEIVDNRDGDELFEIPPEQLRKIGESLKVPLIGETGVHGVDVKT